LPSITINFFYINEKNFKELKEFLSILKTFVIKKLTKIDELIDDNFRSKKQRRKALKQQTIYVKYTK